MAKKYKPVDLSKLRTYSIRDRSHKFDSRLAARLPDKGTNFLSWWESLPPYLGTENLRRLVAAILAARKADRPVVLALGAHVVKVGCSPIVCDLMERGLVTAVALNGATAIHDVEVAIFGQTSEEVADTIRDGSFGMVEETPAFFVDAMTKAPSNETGLGEAIGRHLNETRPPNLSLSILATAARLGLPATVHIAYGTDTIHMHANVAQSDLADHSAIDFRLICGVVADMAPASGATDSGVWANVGSAVLLPEVFLKAVAVARNLGANLDNLITANLDMLRHYRPSENVIGRPVKKGRGLSVVGHHEILLPLLRQALIESA